VQEHGLRTIKVLHFPLEVSGHKGVHRNIKDARLFHDQEKTISLSDKHGIDVAAEAIVVLSRVLPQGADIPHICRNDAGRRSPRHPLMPY
jgi:hypothetical protein